MSLIPRRPRFHDAADRVHELRPAILLARQLGLASSGEPVELGFMVGFADAPLGFQPALFLEAVNAG